MLIVSLHFLGTIVPDFLLLHCAILGDGYQIIIPKLKNWCNLGINSMKTADKKYGTHQITIKNLKEPVFVVSIPFSFLP